MNYWPNDCMANQKREKIIDEPRFIKLPYKLILLHCTLPFFEQICKKLIEHAKR